MNVVSFAANDARGGSGKIVWLLFQTTCKCSNYPNIAVGAGEVGCASSGQVVALVQAAVVSEHALW